MLSPTSFLPTAFTVLVSRDNLENTFVEHANVEPVAAVISDSGGSYRINPMLIQFNEMS